MYQASISDGQLFLLKSAFNPRKVNDFLDDALKALNAFWFSWRLASLHWFVLLAVDFYFFFFASRLKQVLKVSLLLLRSQRWLKQRGRAVESLKYVLSQARNWGEKCSLQTMVEWWAVVRKDPALLLGRELICRETCQDWRSDGVHGKYSPCLGPSLQPRSGHL